MHQHDQRARPDVVDQPGERDEHNGGYMVNDLLFEILQAQTQNTRWQKKKNAFFSMATEETTTTIKTYMNNLQ